MRKPGRLLLRLVQVLGLSRLRETVVLPAVADMQHECAEAESLRRRAWALARGYWSIVSASAFYLALSPARHFREDWSSMEAPGPRLVRRAWPVAVFVQALWYGYVGIMVATSNEGWRLPAGSVPSLLTAMVAMTGPAALAVGVGWVLARDRSGARASLALGLLATGFSFAFIDTVVLRAHQSWVASFQAPTGRSAPLRRGMHEMGFLELGAAKAVAVDNACASQAKTSPCGGGPSLTLLRLEWHRRLSIPALALSFVMLAAGLSRSGRRGVVVLGLWPTYVAAIWLLDVGRLSGSRGEIPAALAVWGAHLVPLALAFIVYAFARRRELNQAPLQPAGS